MYSVFEYSRLYWTKKSLMSVSRLITSSDYLWRIQIGLGCELDINGYKKLLMNSSPIDAVNLTLCA